MILGIGLFFVGLVLFAILALLVGAALDDFAIGLIVTLSLPIVIGVYCMGKFLATQLNWI